MSSVCCQNNINCFIDDDHSECTIDQKDLQEYQRADIGMMKLSRYDKFYRMAGEPLIRIHIHEFIDDLEEMGSAIKWNSITSFDKKF